MNGALATKLETVAVAVVGVVSQGYVTRLTIVVGDVDAIALEPLRDRLRYLVDKRFRGELSKCEGCKLCR